MEVPPSETKLCCGNLATPRWELEALLKRHCQAALGKKGQKITSPEFTIGGRELQLCFYPKGLTKAKEGQCSSFATNKEAASTNKLAD